MPLFAACLGGPLGGPFSGPLGGPGYPFQQRANYTAGGPPLWPTALLTPVGGREGGPERGPAKLWRRSLNLLPVFSLLGRAFSERTALSLGAQLILPSMVSSRGTGPQWGPYSQVEGFMPTHWGPNSLSEGAGGVRIAA